MAKLARSAGAPSGQTTQQTTARPPSRAAAAAAHQGRPAPAQGAASAHPDEAPPHGEPATATQAPAAETAPARVVSGARAAAPAQTGRAVAAPAVHLPATREDEFGAVPAFAQADAGMGMENIRHEDIATPRIKLIQSVSPELQAFDGLKAGQFLHSMAEFSLGDEFIGVPIYMERSHILWRPRKAGGGLLARAGNDGRWNITNGEFNVQLDNGRPATWKMARTVAESGLGLWGSSDPTDNRSPPAATQMYNFVLAFPDYPDIIPAIITFQRAGIKEGRNFNGKLKTLAATRAMFGLRFKFSSTVARNTANQEYHAVQVTGDQAVTDPEEYARYKAMYMSFKDMGLSDRAIEGLQDADDAPTDGVGGGEGQPSF